MTEPDPVRCRCCRRRIGWSYSDRVPAVMCGSPECWPGQEIGQRENRDELLLYLSCTEGWISPRIEELFEISRQRVLQIRGARRTVGVQRK